MKKSTLLFSAALVALFVSSCSVTEPLSVSAAPLGTKTGVSSTSIVFGSKTFSDTKMSTAKVATKNACLSVKQVMEIAKLFSMDDDKLAYAKFAYDRCVDKANYYQVGEIFAFSTTTDELNKFLDK